ncbi:MAG: deoxyribose-phosphate aldolase [bacterium]|nr:deoxyribose-phosphate aldolase [bacterium]
MNASQLAAMIDHTLLKPDATPEQIERICREAMECRFAAVCVNPVYVSVVSRLLEGTDVTTCSVIGFPLGAATTANKIAEAREAIRLGAREIDMVLWVGGLKAGQDAWVEDDVARVADACHQTGARLKVILECALLSENEKRRACGICFEANADFVKTSTGFGPGGATVDDVRLLSSLAKPVGVGVKAAGGIRTLQDALNMVAAGATRIGTSGGVKIVAEARAAEN